MEKQQHSKYQVCIFEALGTSLLLLSLNWATTTPINGKIDPEIQNNSVESILDSRRQSEVIYNPFSLSTVFAICIILFGPVSGGHFNPAITIGVLVKEISLKTVNLSQILFTFAIILSQIIGGFLGVLVSYLSINDTDNFREIRITYLCSILTDPENEN